RTIALPRSLCCRLYRTNLIFKSKGKYHMNHLIKKSLFIALGVSLSLGAQAHRAWILPASTVLSGDDPWVTFDGAVSNDIFHIDHAPLRLESVQVMGPDAQPVELQNTATGKHRSTFDLNLKEKGT